MKKQLLVLLAIILSYNCYSQITFEKGYYIDNTNKKINCLIKNIDWKNSPNEFEFKLSENGEVNKAKIESVKEFGIDEIAQYVRRTVDIDRSSETLSKLSNEKKPVFKKEELFLKVLVKSEASLYQYVDGNLRRFFYSKDNSNIEQLIYKKYVITEDKIGQNNRFRQQLWNGLKCADLKASFVKNLNYNKKDLVSFFKKYNSCNNEKYVYFENEQKRDLFNLTIRPRINSSSLSIQNSRTNYKNADFGSKVGFGFGIEAEFILPFNKNKWAIAIEPTFQNFKSEKITNVDRVVGGKLIANVEYSSIELPISLRHYLFLNNNSKFFVNLSYILDFNSKSSFEFTRNDGSNYDSLEIKTKPNIGLGIGYKQNDRYSLEMRFQTVRDVLSNFVSWNSEYKTLSIIFGYSFF